MDNEFLPRRKKFRPDGFSQGTGSSPNRFLSPSRFRAADFTPVADETELAAPENPTPVPAPAPTPASPEPNLQTITPPPGDTPPPAVKRSFRQTLRNLSKKQRILIVIVLFVLLSGGAAAAYLLTREQPKPVVRTSVVKKEEPKAPEPTTIPSTLTGLQVEKEVNQRPVTAVMIENSESARPQSGLIDAGVVFEAIAEGGITRFLTLFQDTSPEYIGPVRSVRPYYVQWLAGFDAAVAHVGGSNEALAMLRQGVAKDLDQFSNSGPYWRVSNRAAPHNMYSSVVKLRELQIKKGWPTSTYTGFARSDKENPSAQPTARIIDFNISGALYNSHYDWDAASNTYLRSEGGKPHVDAAAGQQIAAKVVIGLVMGQGKNGIYTTYATIGSGRVFVFQDGIVTEGTWEKAGNSSQFTFKDNAGAVIKLNPGKTWLTVIGGAERVTYQP